VLCVFLSKRCGAHLSHWWRSLLETRFVVTSTPCCRWMLLLHLSAHLYGVVGPLLHVIDTLQRCCCLHCHQKNSLHCHCSQDVWTSSQTIEARHQRANRSPRSAHGIW
jgi:hypothetical protein